MTAALLVLAVGGPITFGFLLMRAAWLGTEPAPGNGLPLSLAVGWGIGFSSITFYLWRLLIGAPGLLFVGSEVIALIVVSIALGCMNWRKRGQITNSAGTPMAFSRFTVIVGAVLLIQIVSMVIIFMGSYRLSPHGDWDAWATWNTRARLLFRAGTQWRQTFAPVVSHSDYPLLLPASVARCWVYARRETTVAYAAVALLFAFAILGMLVSSLAWLRGTTQAFLAGILLLGNRAWLKAVPSEMADIPISFFFLATCVIFASHDCDLNGRRWLPALAGTCAGMAGWTKNEGLLFLVAILSSRLLIGISRGWRHYWRETKSFMTGLIPVLAIVISFKMSVPANDLMEGQDSVVTLMRLWDWPRYWVIARTFAIFALMIGPGALGLLLVYALLLGRAPETSAVRAGLHSALVLTLMLAGYFMIYVITPHHPVEHMANSLDRLLLQLWPLGVFTFFTLVATPEERWIRAPAAPSNAASGVE